MLSSKNSFLAEICQKATQLLTWFIHDQFYFEWTESQTELYFNINKIVKKSENFIVPKMQLFSNVDLVWIYVDVGYQLQTEDFLKNTENVYSNNVCKWSLCEEYTVFWAGRKPLLNNYFSFIQ